MKTFEFDTSDAKMVAQVKLEADMMGMGERRYNENLKKNREKGREGNTSYGSHLIRAAIPKMVEAFTAVVDSNKPGPRARASKYLEQVDLDIAAFITAKHILNGVAFKKPVTPVAYSLGCAIEDEVRFTIFRNKHPGFWKWMLKDTETANTTHKSRVFRVASKESESEEVWSKWDRNDLIHLGLKCIDIFIETTDLVELTTLEFTKHRKTLYLSATPATIDWIRRKNEYMVSLDPVYLPTVIPPKEWTGAYGGGYYTPAIRPLKLIKTRNRTYLDEINNRPEEMKQVLDSINNIQNVGWKVNTKVLEVMEEAWELDLDLGKLPLRSGIEFPVCPLGKDEKYKEASEAKQVQFKAWKRQMTQLHKLNVKLKSKILMASKIMNTANKFKDQDAFYFPHQFDFRGRIYAVPMYLQPQGNDLAKGLLTFAEGKAITNNEQADWLGVQGANTWGYDKASLADRAMWAYLHTNQVKAVVQDPITNQWWADADKPWQFLAWCFEWAAYIEQGFGFKSSLPIALDGSCNGLQHFSAMLRDSTGGAAVNLTPTDEPQDIYQEVANKTIELLKADKGESPYSERWLQWGVGRKDTKRSVMIVPYSGTLHSSNTYIVERVQERLEAGEEDIWGEDKMKAAMYLGKLVWQAIDETVVAARGAMKWLKETAKILSKEELPVNWTTPDGFHVLQAYACRKSGQIKTVLGEKIYRLRVDTEIEALDKGKQASGISPNFVHSLDATALRMTVNACANQGVTNLSLIHDSYGTCAADTLVLAATLRDEFVMIYQEDVLEKFKQEVEVVLDEPLPATPPKGDLDIEVVRDSQFFFA